MRFTQDFIEKVRDANNLVEIISPYTELKRTGDRLMGRCPFPDHAEKTPSFSVSEDKQLYHCFGCKKSGNIFTFLETFSGMSFPEAVEYLAKRASIPLPVDESGKSRGSGSSRDTRDLLLKINALAGGYFHQQLKHLPKEHPAVRYMQTRGLSDDIIEKFRLGIALEPWEGLVTVFQQKKVPFALAESLGLIKRKKSGAGYFDLFRERILFPIFSATDDLLGFGGRTYADGTPKYLNSPESAVFSKGKILYGLHETGKFIRSEDRAIVVEGYMDAIALYSAGIKNVVAILGTAFTPDHAKLLKRYTHNVTMLLDGDDAGINAAERSLSVLLQSGLLVKGCFLPDRLDPDEFVKSRGVEALREEVARAPELFSLMVGRWMRDYRGTPSEKVKLVDEIFPVLKVMANRQLRELYIGEVAQRLDVEMVWLNRALAAAAQNEKNPPGRPFGTDGGPLPRSIGAIRPVGSIRSNGQQHSQQHGQHEWLSQKHGQANAATVATEVMVKAKVEAALASSTDKSTDRDHEWVPERSVEVDRVSVKDAPRDEAFVLSLVLHNETLLQEAHESDLIEVLGHPGVKRLLSLALEKYGQRPDEFDKLAASLASQIDIPGIITCSLEVTRHLRLKADASGEGTGVDESEERRLMTDYVNAIRKRYLRTQGKALANQLRDQSNPEMLEQFMNIQKIRHSLDKE